MTSAKWLPGAALVAAGVIGITSGGLWAPQAIAADAAAAAAAAAPKIGAKIGKPLKAAQDAMQLKNWDEAMTQIAAAQAIEPKTPYEQYMTNEMLWFVQLQTKKYVEAAGVIEQQLATGLVPEAEVPLRTKTLTQLNYQNENYAKAIEVGNQYLATAPADKDISLLVAQSYALTKDYAGANRIAQQAMTAGGKPDEQLLRIALRSNFELKDRAATVGTLEQLVRHYPKQEYWRDLLTNNLFQTKGDRELRHLYRLMDEVGTLDDGDNCSEAGAVMLAGGFPSEAGKILDRCSSAGLFQGEMKARAQTSQEAARRGAEADRKDLATASAALASAKTGNDMVATGKLFFSTGDYAKAADAIAKGLTKGGVTDATDATMLLGIAQARGGQSQVATATFNSVTDAKAAPVARLWALRMESLGAAAPAAAQAGG